MGLLSNHKQPHKGKIIQRRNREIMPKSSQTTEESLDEIGNVNSSVSVSDSCNAVRCHVFISHVPCPVSSHPIPSHTLPNIVPSTKTQHPISHTCPVSMSRDNHIISNHHNLMSPPSLTPIPRPTLPSLSSSQRCKRTRGPQFRLRCGIPSPSRIARRVVAASLSNGTPAEGVRRGEVGVLNPEKKARSTRR